MTVQITILSDSPQEAAMEIMSLAETFRGRYAVPETVQAHPVRVVPAEDTDPPASKLKTKPRGGRPGKITEEVVQGDEDRKEAAQAVPETDEPVEIDEAVVKAKLQELQRLMGPAKATSWFRGAFKVQKFSEIDRADWPTVVRTVEQRLTVLIEKEG